MFKDLIGKEFWFLNTKNGIDVIHTKSTITGFFISSNENYLQFELDNNFVSTYEFNTFSLDELNTTGDFTDKEKQDILDEYWNEKITEKISYIEDLKKDISHYEDLINQKKLELNKLELELVEIYRKKNNDNI